MISTADQVSSLVEKEVWSTCKNDPVRTEGGQSGVGCLERMKDGSGIKDLDNKSSGIEILMSETFTKINPTDPLILDKQTARRK